MEQQQNLFHIIIRRADNSLVTVFHIFVGYSLDKKNSVQCPT